MAAKKYLALVAGVFKEIVATVVSAGAADDGKIVALDANGKLDLTVMPTGIGPDVNTLTASEALSANDLVNVWNDAGTAKMRKADAASNKPANGFVLAAVSSGASGTMYSEGTNAGLTGLTAGPLYLSATTPGGVSNSAPTDPGQIVQRVGVAVSATAMNFEAGPTVELA